MIIIKNFVFNPFGVNTFLLFDETAECVIIDPGCFDSNEEMRISEFIEVNKLRPVRLFNTHTHVDHIAGNKYIAEKYSLKLEVHEESLKILSAAKLSGEMFGFDNIKEHEPAAFISDGDKIKFGNSEIEVIYTPGHAEGSVCFYSEKDKFVITGDVLFNESVGRTDLPGGNFKSLMESINTRLLVLPDDTVVYAGHGQPTSIGHEKEYNPFLNQK